MNRALTKDPIYLAAIPTSSPASSPSQAFVARRYLEFHYIDHLGMSFIYGWLICHTIGYPRIEGVRHILCGKASTETI